MNAEQLMQLAATYMENKEFINNEETAKMSLVVPFIRLLGYEPNVPREVRLEYSADFVQGDGKKLPDRMDFAIFDRTGSKPLFVIETKPLGTNLRAKSQQLARYIAQLPDLHFGIITDGCEYLFYGDLDSPNQMCTEPYFSFALSDSKTDWSKVAAFLSKYSRDNFNAETLKTEAENNRYRQAMIKKLVSILRDPSENEAFMKWLTEDIVQGKRTVAVMTRMNELAKEAVEPSLLRVMGDEFVEKLKQRINDVSLLKSDGEQTVQIQDEEDGGIAVDSEAGSKKGIVTTVEEHRFHALVADICAENGYERSRILERDTVNYFNVSVDRPTKWFLRYFGDQKRKNVVTPLPVDVARELANGLEVEECPPSMGVSRIYIEDVEQMKTLVQVVMRSLETTVAG